MPKRKPSPPREPSAIDQSLKANDHLQLHHDVAGHIVRAKVQTPFDLLRSRNVIHGDHMLALERLHRDLAIRHMTAGASGNGQSTAPNDFPFLRIEAARRILAIMARMDHRNCQLILALSEPTILRGERVDWRKTVEKVMLEPRQAKQSALVRQACDDLLKAT